MDSIHHRRTKGQRASVDSYHPCEYTHSLLLPVYLTQPPTLSPTRIISITDTDQSSTTALTTLLITTSNRYYWLRIATPLLTTLELSSFLSTIILFATALSLDRLSRSMEPQQPDSAALLSRSVDDLHGTIARIRTAIFELHGSEDVSPAAVRKRLAHRLWRFRNRGGGRSRRTACQRQRGAQH